MNPPKHYVPFKHSATFWMFTTPSGEVRNIISEDRAKKLAVAHEKQDREEARTNFTSPIAAVLRKYFDTLPPDPPAGSAETPAAEPVASLAEESPAIAEQRI